MRYLEQDIPAAYEISNIPVHTKRPRAKHTPSHDETTIWNSCKIIMEGIFQN